MSKHNVKVLILTPYVYSYGSMVIAALEEAGFSVNLMKISLNTGITSLPQANIFAIGLYSTLHILEFKECVANLKSKYKRPIVLGGPVVQVLELEFTNTSFVDAVILGEGEETIVDLVEALVSHRDLEAIDGIAFALGRQSGEDQV